MLWTDGGGSAECCDFVCRISAERLRRLSTSSRSPVSQPVDLQFVSQHTHTHTHTYTHTHLTAHWPGLPGWAGTRKVKPIWILLKQETVSGSGISWTICKSAPRSRQITTPAPHHSVFNLPPAIECTAFSALTLLAGRQEQHPACKNWVMRCLSFFY